MVSESRKLMTQTRRVYSGNLITASHKFKVNRKILIENQQAAVKEKQRMKMQNNVLNTNHLRIFSPERGDDAKRIKIIMKP